jgi:hypothetical protein
MQSEYRPNFYSATFKALVHDKYETCIVNAGMRLEKSSAMSHERRFYTKPHKLLGQNYIHEL